MENQLNSLILHKARKAANLSYEKAAVLVCAGAKSFQNWEMGRAPNGIPRYRWRLFFMELPEAAKAEGYEIVIIRDSEGEVIDCLAHDQLYELTGEGNFDVVKSLAIDRDNKRPYLHKTVFDINFNREAYATMSQWKQLK